MPKGDLLEWHEEEEGVYSALASLDNGKVVTLTIARDEAGMLEVKATVVLVWLGGWEELELAKETAQAFIDKMGQPLI